MANIGSLSPEYEALVQHWLLRLLVHQDLYRHVVEGARVTEPTILRAVGLDLGEDAPETSEVAIRQELKKRLGEAERGAVNPSRTSPITRNLAWLKTSLGLSSVQADIVLFLALTQLSCPLGKLLEKLGAVKTHETMGIIATAIGHSFEQVSSALFHTGKLVKSGLVSLDLVSRWNFEAKIFLLAGVAEQLPLHLDDPSEMFLSNLRRSAPPLLKLADFPHLGEDITILTGFLRQAMETSQKGVNILIWGPPGTGKTQLAAALAARLGADLFEVQTQDRYGTLHKGEARLAAYQLAQGVLAGKAKALVLFDELEDAFRLPTELEGGSRQGNQSGRKGWVNQLLESNMVPAIWITNNHHVLDPAYLRRQSFILEVSIPPRSVRERLLDTFTAGLPVSGVWKQAMADHDGLSPAAIEKAANVTRSVMVKAPELMADAVMGRVLGNGLEALGLPRQPRFSAASSTPYRLDLLNTDRDLTAICEGLRRTGSGRLALYGPPGTGKTAFGHHLAQLLDRPLLLKRASDLQSKWLGETEQSMARMFREAATDGAVLLLDEADSFLRDRRAAEKSWEVSQVNEMLTQLETYQGIFIASTNLIESLDQAAFRRFDLKIRFGYIGREQAAMVLQDTLAALGLPQDPAATARVARLTCLTPGDYSAVLRQARLACTGSAAEVVELLAQEVAMKEGGNRRPIGFQTHEAVN